jgi:putative sigma-54 modulation protein
MTQITISGHHIEVTEGLTSAVNNKFQKLLNRYPDITSINVYLSVEKHEQTAEGVIHFLGQDLVAKAKADDLYTALADLKPKLDGLLKKRKATIKDHARERIDIAQEELADDALDEAI